MNTIREYLGGALAAVGIALVYLGAKVSGRGE